MRELDELQARFANALLDDLEAGGINSWVCENGVPAERRIAVYRNNSRISQAEALAGIYPAIQQLVGETFFEHMADDYGVQYPSTSGDLREYGGKLTNFLSSYEPVTHLSYLPDVACLEWAWHECFHAAAARHTDATALTALADETGEDIYLALIPASRLVLSPYPVASIWEFALNPEMQQQKLDLNELGESRLLMSRPEENVNVMELTPEQFFWLDLIGAGVTLTSLLEQTLERYPDFDFATNLATFVGLGILMIQHSA